jgi:hypothetical protein
MSKFTQLPGPCQCHPRVGTQRPPGGCIPINTLQEIAKSLNISTSASAKHLRKALEMHFKVEPNKEHTFLQSLPLSPEVKQDLAKQYLRPEVPAPWIKDPDKWLDSNDIIHVMNQYEDAYANFEFMGPFPIDFAAPDPYQKGGDKKCLMNEMCELRVQSAKENGTDYIGVIYNLDPHYKSGSHWVATFIDLKKHRCLYFDSYGMEPPAQIAKFMKWLTTQDPKMELHYNARRIQFKNTECGMYSLCFIIRMLMGDELVTFSRKAPSDKGMMDLRHCLFAW